MERMTRIQHHFDAIEQQYQGILDHVDEDQFLLNLKLHIKAVIGKITSDCFQLTQYEVARLKYMIEFIIKVVGELDTRSSLRTELAECFNDILDMTKIFPGFRPRTPYHSVASKAMITLHRELFARMKKFILNQQNHCYTDVYVRSFLSVLKYINTEKPYKDTFYDYVHYVLRPTNGRDHLPEPLFAALLKSVPPVILENRQKERNKKFKEKLMKIYQDICIEKLKTDVTNAAAIWDPHIGMLCYLVI